MNVNNLCCIVIPVYKSLGFMDILVVRQAVEMTKGFNKVFVAPKNFLFDSSFDEFRHFEVEYFSKEFFHNIEGYNRLMLSSEFYERFILYENILIHQTDAHLFKEELEYWCMQGYDYIGAPWYFPDYKDNRLVLFVKTRFMKFFYADEHINDLRHINKVGNGGLSLRKVSSALAVLQAVPPALIEKYRKASHYVYNEDTFWALEAKVVKKDFRIPKMKDAMRFSLEKNADLAYQQIAELPFGCHAFDVHSTEFWEKHISFLNK